MSIFNIFHKAGKKTKIAVAVLLTGLAIGVPAVTMAGFGPNGADRKIFDFSNPAEREGAFDAPRFNSYINTNVYGDERAFLDTKECVVNGPDCYKQGVAGGFLDKSTAVIGKEYIVRAYVHNIANPSTNGANNTGIGVAKDTKIRFEIPNGQGNGFTMQARITASNSIPTEVFDTADITNTGIQAFDLQYVPGSAFISNAAHKDGLQLSDDVVGPTGTLVGFDQMNGVWPGCFDFSAFVTIRVKVVAPSIDVQKGVSKLEAPKPADLQNQITAKKGEAITWRIDFKNVSGAIANNLTIRDPLPAGLTLVPGSITWLDSNHPTGQALPDTALGSGGTNLGNYPTGSNGVIRFRTKINEDFKDCEIKNVGFGRADSVTEKSDDAKVVIENCVPPQEVVKCDALTSPRAEIKPNEQVVLTAAGSVVNGNPINRYVFSVNGVTKQDSAAKTFTFSSATVGSFTIRVAVSNGSGQPVSADSCVKEINVKEEVAKIVTCDSLTPAGDKTTIKVGEKLTYTVHASKSGGATIKGYIFSVDGVKAKETNSEADNTFEFTQTVAKDYMVSAVVKSDNNLLVANANCAKKVTVTNEFCALPGKTNFLKNDKINCAEVLSLTDTGAGDVFGIFASVTVGGAIWHRFWSSRRLGGRSF